MNFPFYIARRYLFSKKSHNAINIISMVSVCGVVVATIALVCALSVYNGFNDLVSTLFGAFDPQLKITPLTGKVFDPTSAAMQKVRTLPEVAVFSEVLQDNALVKYDERQTVAIVKGVADNFGQLTQIDSILLDGTFTLHEDVVNYATLGVGLASSLGAGAAFMTPLQFFVPKRNEKINMANPIVSSNLEYAQVAAVFCLNQPVYDENYVIVPLSLARDLFDYETEVSSVELKLKDGADINKVKAEIAGIVGSGFLVQDQYEQQEASFKMMQVEKWITFLILCFILSIALFNVVGSLSMLMIEKQADVRTLRNMGASDKLISRIFLFEGWMISGFGSLIGVVLGLVLCLLQQNLGLLKFGDTSGAFIIDAYPVRVLVIDVVTVFFTVLSIGFIAAWYPVHYLGKKWLKG